jgi:hypothetical protein
VFYIKPSVKIVSSTVKQVVKESDMVSTGLELIPCECIRCEGSCPTTTNSRTSVCSRCMTGDHSKAGEIVGSDEGEE